MADWFPVLFNHCLPFLRGTALVKQITLVTGNLQHPILANWSIMVGPELLADICRSYGAAAVRYPVLEVRVIA